MRLTATRKTSKKGSETKQLNKEVRSRVKVLENEYYASKANELNFLHEKRQIEQEFAKVKNDGESSIQKTSQRLWM